MIGALAAIVKMSYDAKKNRSRPVINMTPAPTSTAVLPASVSPQRPAIPLPAAPTVYWVAARRDGAVWAGPWKSDGVGFTRVPKNYWKFKSREAAQQAIDSDHLENCEPQELDPE